MPEPTFPLLFFVLLGVFTVAHSQITHRDKIFLAPHETYLFFPHRHFRSISTYTSNCTVKPAELALQHLALTNVASFNFNNSNLGISILSEDPASTVFYYAKINPNDICTVYQVDQEQIRILYEHNLAGEFSNIVLLDKFHAFLWNCERFARMEYSMYSSKVAITEARFEVEDSWSCRKYKEGVMLCWGIHQITIINLQEASFQMEVCPWPYPDQQIRVILPLDKTEDIFLICTFTICNITRILQGDTLMVLQYMPFVLQILGADFNSETGQIVTVHAATAVIFSYDSRTHSISLEESVDFYSDLECVFIENVRFLNEQILINCNNFMGEAEHLALIRDRQLNKFFSYQPLRSSAPDNPCIFDGNQKYIFALCKRAIATMMNNFAYFQINETAVGSTISIECLDYDQDAIKIPENFELAVTAADYGEAYVNNPMENRSINFEGPPLTIQLKDKFTASAIDHYTVISPDCPYLGQSSFNNIDTQYFVSLYIRERCVQVAAADNRNFYRVLQINETVFYIELCMLVKAGFACQLQEIMDNVLGFRLLTFNFRLFKLYIRQGNLIIEEGKYVDVIFEEVTNYEMRDQVIRVRSRNKLFSNTVRNVVNNCGAWIEETEHFFYLYGQEDIFQADKQGSVSVYRNSSKHNISLKIPISSLLKNRPFTLPYLLSKGYYLFLINDTHITKLYQLETSIVIYQLPYNAQGYTIGSIRSVDNYIVIYYQIGFFEIYDTQRESVAALIAIQQEEVLGDIVMMDRDVLLVPLIGQMYVLRIQTDPVLTIDKFPPFYNKFHQQCFFIITPHLSNGSCPGTIQNDQPTVYQVFNLSIQFDIQKIGLQTQNLLLQLPRECSNCVFQIPEDSFLGPIFAFQFNDDDFGTFDLVAHLNVDRCEPGEQGQLVQMVEVPTADETARSELLMMNGTHLLLVDQSLNQTGIAIPLNHQTKCISYTLIENEYLLLCEHVFLLFGKISPLTAVAHNISLDSYPNSHFEMKSEAVRDRLYYVYIRDQLLMHIQLLCLNSRTVQYVSLQQLAADVVDFAVVRDNVITLQDGQICISTSEAWRTDCFPLNTIIPSNYAEDYNYQSILTYHATSSLLRALLISKTNHNLHVDVEIDLSDKPARFRLLNAYAGYVGYSLKGIVSISKKEDGSYSNFILHYEDTQDTISSSIVAYYKFNHNFGNNGSIGHIRSAIFMANYFRIATSFAFLSFPHQLYITNITQLGSPAREYKKCVSVRVEDSLKVVSNYHQPSLLKFLILKVKNINDLQTYYIKITYDPQPGLLKGTLIALAVTIFFFVAFGLTVRRYQDAHSELTIHFMSEEVERQFSEDSPSDLLHSNSSPSSPASPRSYSPRGSQDELDWHDITD